MGNRFSLTIQLDNDGSRKPIVAGTRLSGEIILKVNRKMNQEDLFLHLTGEETTIVSKGMANVRDDRVIARAITQLRKSGRKKIPKGVYRVPFQFSLPASLPSTTRFPRLDRRAFNGRIKYTLKAKFGKYELERGFVVASAPLPADIVPCLAPPTTYELKSFGILNKGFLSVGASVENSRVGRGQAIRISIASQNNASVDIERVRVKLVELIEYQAQQESKTLKVELEKFKDIDNLPGIVKNRAGDEDVRRGIREGAGRNMEATYRQIYEDLVSGENQIDVVVPNVARDSYDGTVMKITHYLKITFFTKALVENPSIKIPLMIGNPSEAEVREQATPRSPNEPIATVIYDDELRSADSGDVGEEDPDDIEIEVGSRAETIPMVDAVVIGGQQRSLLDSPTQENSTGENGTVVLGSEHVFTCGDSVASSVTNMSIRLPMPPPIAPSAPPESLLRQNDYDDDNSEGGASADLLPETPVQQRRPQSTLPRNAYQSPSQQPSIYSPYNLYNSQQARPRVESYSYTDSDVEESHRYSVDTSVDTSYEESTVGDSPSRQEQAPNGNQPRHPDSQWLFDELVEELKGSIHDYEVIASKIRDKGYRKLFASLSATEYATLVYYTTMSHQVQVARVIAKKNRNFTCEHCALAIGKTSEYFRSNMAETLIRYCKDFADNKSIIEDELSEWEQIITSHAFEDAFNKNKRQWV